APHAIDLGQRPRLELAMGVAAIAHRVTGDENIARSRYFQMVDAAKEGALSGAAGAEHAHDVAAPDLERDALEHFERSEFLVHVDHSNRRYLAHRSTVFGRIWTNVGWMLRAIDIDISLLYDRPGQSALAS